MEKLIKQKLLERGFSGKTLLNNRGLIGAVIDETKEAVLGQVRLNEINNYANKKTIIY